MIAKAFSLDFTLHGEKGKNKKRPYGSTPSQSKKRFSKKRDKSSIGKLRINEHSESKIDVAISMIAFALKKGIDVIICLLIDLLYIGKIHYYTS